MPHRPDPLTAARIRAARAYADLTQSQIGDRLGVSHHTIRRLEHPWLPTSRHPRPAELIAIAHICDVPPDWLQHGWDQ